ncbi:BamA/TamA family outer membrane protein [Shimia thalassica]|uniref:autotransporter assembly complex protein TamA n=1 Tax=Shimia thalassica TaxID=1715693 RepID=UPI002494F604|nr:BamA/TamA family outer membrane protein [Shimia thalassica]MDO6799088.1 BamA/TamA family outer membrane protein [Shimia thalassica]
MADMKTGDLSSLARALSGVVLTGFLACAGLPASAFELIWTGDVSDDMQKALKNASLLEAAQRDEVTDVQEIIANAQAEYRRMVSVLYAQGFFGPKVHVYIDGREAATLPPFQRINTISKIQVDVTSGDSFSFGRAEVTPLAPETAIPEGFARGEPARTSVITSATTEAYKAWRSAGHAKVQVTSQDLVANHKDDTLDVKIGMNPGPLLRFGDLTISTESYVREGRLREIMDLPSGEQFDPEELERGRKRLHRTGAFRSVTIAEAKTANPDDTLDIDLTVSDEKRRRLAFEAELESRDGLSLSTYWIHRNVFGGAERLRIEGEVAGIGAQTGGIDYSLSAELIRPATFNADSEVAFRLEASQVDDPLYFLNQIEGALTFTRVYSDEFQFSAGILFQRSNVKDDFGDRQFATVGLPASVTWDQRNHPLDATNGYYLKGSVMPFTDFKSGEPGTYLQGDVRGFVTPGDFGLTFAGRFQFGSIIGPSLAETPPDMLFYTGGGGTVRGQPYQSNNVTNGGITSGGLSYAAISGEIRYKFRPAMSAVLFYDVGFVGDTSDFQGSGNTHSGAGIGFRYHTDFGPIRVDLATPVSGTTGDGLQLYIGIGQAF